MKSLSIISKIAALVLCLASSFVQAQSAGGGLGGDRPKFYSAPKPTVIEHTKMRCEDLTEKIRELGKVRLNFASEKAPVYQLVYSKLEINCRNVRDQDAISVQTIDSNRCYAGYICLDR